MGLKIETDAKQVTAMVTRTLEYLDELITTYDYMAALASQQSDRTIERIYGFVSEEVDAARKIILDSPIYVVTGVESVEPE